MLVIKVILHTYIRYDITAILYTSRGLSYKGTKNNDKQS